MKTWIVFLALFGVFLLLGCIGGEVPPEDIVKDFVYAYVGLNTEKANSYTITEIQTNISSAIAAAKALGATTEIQEFRVENKSIVGDSATITFYTKTKILIAGIEQTVEQTQKINLVKVEGVWKISSLPYYVEPTPGPGPGPTPGPGPISPAFITGTFSLDVLNCYGDTLRIHNNGTGTVILNSTTLIQKRGALTTYGTVAGNNIIQPGEIKVIPLTVDLYTLKDRVNVSITLFSLQSEIMKPDGFKAKILTNFECEH